MTRKIAALALLASLRGLQESSGSSVAQRLRALSGTVGVMGPIAFTEDGDIRRALRNHWIHGGKVEDFDSFLEKERRAGGGA